MSEKLLELHSAWGDSHNAADKLQEAIIAWKANDMGMVRFQLIEAEQRLAVALAKVQGLLL